MTLISRGYMLLLNNEAKGEKTAFFPVRKMRFSALRQAPASRRRKIPPPDFDSACRLICAAGKRLSVYPQGVKIYVYKRL